MRICTSTAASHSAHASISGDYFLERSERAHSFGFVFCLPMWHQNMWEENARQFSPSINVKRKRDTTISDTEMVER